MNHAKLSSTQSSTTRVVCSFLRSATFWSIDRRRRRHPTPRMLLEYPLVHVLTLLQGVQENARVREDLREVRQARSGCGYPRVSRNYRHSLSLHLLIRPQFRTLRRESDLTQFEIAQIANLCPVTAEESKSIIPRQLVHSSNPRRPILISLL